MPGWVAYTYKQNLLIAPISTIGLRMQNLLIVPADPQWIGCQASRMGGVARAAQTARCASRDHSRVPVAGSHRKTSTTNRSCRSDVPKTCERYGALFFSIWKGGSGASTTMMRQILLVGFIQYTGYSVVSYQVCTRIILCYRQDYLWFE